MLRAVHLRSTSSGVSVCFMTVGELAYGAEESSRPEWNRALVECFLLTVPVIESDRSSMRILGRLKTSIEGKGGRLADADLMIAAVALDRGLILATGNLRLYSRIPGLRSEDWLHCV